MAESPSACAGECAPAGGSGVEALGLILTPKEGAELVGLGRRRGQRTGGRWPRLRGTFLKPRGEGGMKSCWRGSGCGCRSLSACERGAGGT